MEGCSDVVSLHCSAVIFIWLLYLFVCVGDQWCCTSCSIIYSWWYWWYRWYEWWLVMLVKPPLTHDSDMGLPIRLVQESAAHYRALPLQQHAHIRSSLFSSLFSRLFFRYCFHARQQLFLRMYVSPASDSPVGNSIWQPPYTPRYLSINIPSNTSMTKGSEKGNIIRNKYIVYIIIIV